MTCKNKFQAIIVHGLVLTTLTPYAFAHGEDKPGPHGGIIRMPSSFHTELVSLGEHKLQIYLLDIMFKEPLTENSAVKAEVIDGSERFLLNCLPQAEAFSCSTSEEKTLARGELVLTATRNHVQGGPQRYALPLPSPSHMEPEKSRP